MLIGIDIGTSTVALVALESGSGRLLRSLTLENEAALPAPAGRAEQDPARIWDILRRGLDAMAREELPGAEGVACTGQMHGLLFVNEALEPLSALVSWQDRRAEGVAEEANATLDRLDPEGWRRRGCRIHPGYGAATLAWYLRNGGLPAGTRWVCTISDWIASRLCGAVATDLSNAASWGLLRLDRSDWDREAARELGIPERILPPLREAGAPLGSADLGTLGAGVELACGLGDNQASVLAAIQGLPPEDCCVVNVGTGSQVSVVAAGHARASMEGGALEIRPFVDGRVLCVGASLNGGSAYALLRRFLAQAGGIPVGAAAEELYATMSGWASAVPAGCDGLECDPAFLGERGGLGSGSLRGMTALNLTPGHLCRAVLEGMARRLHELYLAVGLPRRALIGSGNAVRRNAVLRDILASTFGLELRVSRHLEEAAVGAALVASRLPRLRRRATAPGDR